MTFRLNQPVDTREPTLKVTGRRVPGRYRIQLVVTDDSGRVSRPTHVTIEVLPRKTPRRR